MTRYEKQLQEMTIEKMAALRIHSICAGATFLTSDYPDSNVFSNYDEALAHEIEWLKGEVND